MECCVCFSDKEYIVKYDTIDFSNLDKCILKSPCNIHYICVTCLRMMMFDFESHQINSDNSNMFCPYPFEPCINDAGFKHVFQNDSLRNLCTSDIEWERFISYADAFRFTGYTIIQCPMLCGDDNICNTPILVENQSIKDMGIGELIVQCDQNSLCQKRFCYYCYDRVGFFDNQCNKCCLNNECQNINTYNYFINKKPQSVISIVEGNQSYLCDEKNYLYFTHEITPEIVIQQVIDLLDDVNTYMICPICKVSLYKTERCNGLKHHQIERCYACGRIGFRTKGLGDHWNCCGNGGCYRFDYDDVVSKYVPQYVCHDFYCSNHEKGDCKDPEHQKGILMLQDFRKKTYIYHILLSLHTSIKYKTYDSLLALISSCQPHNLVYLPYKQSLILVDYDMSSYKDCTEDIMYENIICKPPYETNDNNFKYKGFAISPEEYITKYKIPPPPYFTSITSSIDAIFQPSGLQLESAWRRLIETEITTPLLHGVSNSSNSITRQYDTDTDTESDSASDG